MFRVDYNKIIDDYGSKANETVVNLFKNNKFRNLMHILNIKATKKSIFLTPNAKKAFNHLKQVFIKALIF